MCRLQTLVCLALLLASNGLALEIREAEWGFGGTVVPGRFNLLSILLVNPSGLAFDGTLRLNKTGVAGRLGAEIVSSCYLAPGSSRWIQFYPYIGEMGEEWRLAWGQGGPRQRLSLTSPRLGAPAVVLLKDPENPLAGTAAIRTFRENLFPPSVTATDGLFAAVLDHSPSWQAPQRQAFFDWLQAGGTLHLIHSGSRSYPVFEGEYKILNDPSDRFMVGGGRVVRHPLRRGQLSAKLLAERGFPATQLTTDAEAMVTNLEEDFLEILRDMTRIGHSWWLIYSLLVLYLVLIGPVSFLLAKKYQSFRFSILLFAALVVSFSLLISRVGRRGYGEATLVKSIAYARSLSQTDYDVTQWVDAFVTRGDVYTMQYAAEFGLFSTCQSFEQVAGIIENGSNPRFTIDIPIYSSRGFLSRSKMKGKALQITKREVTPTKGRQKLWLGITYGDAEIQLAWARYKGAMYRLIPSNGGFQVSSERLSIKQVLEQSLPGEVHGMSLGNLAHWGSFSPRETIRKLAPILIDRSAGGPTCFVQSFPDPAPPADLIELFVLVDHLNEFSLTTKGLERGLGGLLLHTKINLLEAADD